jgi:hypothetical protein
MKPTQNLVDTRFSFRKLALAMLSGPTLFLAGAEPALAGSGSLVAQYDVNFQNLSPALGSYALWQFDFGQPPYSPTPGSDPVNVTVQTGPEWLWGTPIELIPGTVSYFYSGTSTVTVGNYNVSGTASSGFNYNYANFLDRVFYPGNFNYTFSFYDPPAPTTNPIQFSLNLIFEDNNFVNTGYTLGFSTKLYPDGTSQLISSNNVGITQTFGTSPVPVPAAVWLFGSGLLGLIGVARRKRRGTTRNIV